MRRRRRLPCGKRRKRYGVPAEHFWGIPPGSFGQRKGPMGETVTLCMTAGEYADAQGGI
jgi:hypothetical protein